MSRRKKRSVILMVKKTVSKPAKSGREKAHPIDELIETLSASKGPLARVQKETITVLVCLKCGAKSPEEANFCMKCGRKLK